MNTAHLHQILRYSVMFLLAVPVASCGGGGGSDNAGTPPPTLTAGVCSFVTYAAPSGTGNNIVFQFDKAYRCGQFANGDWWVSKDEAAGVTIVAITPSATGTAAGGDIRNGFEVNPSPGVNQQAFDSRTIIPAINYPTLPLTVAGGSSVVKAVSVAAIPNKTAVQFAAVLTVVDAPIANSETYFRPGYSGVTKALYSINSIRTANLPKYNATLPADAPTIESVATRYRQVQIDHTPNFMGDQIRPIDNMPDYGAQIATNGAVSLLRLLLGDFDYSRPSHKLALINYLQWAVDLRAAAAGGQKWVANGGHPHGRKLPLVFAAWILADTTFSDAVSTVNGEFGEDNTLWRSPISGLALYGAAGTDSQYWQTTRGLGGSRIIRDPYGLIDGGGYEIGDAYQYCCSAMPWKYTVLALYMLGLESEWAADGLLIEYVERWVSSGAKSLPDACAPFDGVASNYGITYGPSDSGGCILDANLADGIGRWPQKNGINANDGFYRNSFADQLWTWYKARP